MSSSSLVESFLSLSPRTVTNWSPVAVSGAVRLVSARDTDGISRQTLELYHNLLQLLYQGNISIAYKVPYRLQIRYCTKKSPHTALIGRHERVDMVIPEASLVRVW